MKNIGSLLLFILMTSLLPLEAELVSAPLYGAHLQGKIKISLTVPEKDLSTEIQPGSKIKLSTIIKNIGDKANAPGKIFIRFAFQKPLNANSESILFETEREHLPSIPPGKETVIYFTKAHQWPSLFDYIRDDWSMRQYEVVTEVNNKYEVIGHAAISVSAHYYEGQDPSKDDP